MGIVLTVATTKNRDKMREKKEMENIHTRRYLSIKCEWDDVHLSTNSFGSTTAVQQYARTYTQTH